MQDQPMFEYRVAENCTVDQGELHDARGCDELLFRLTMLNDSVAIPEWKPMIPESCTRSLVTTTRQPKSDISIRTTAGTRGHSLLRHPMLPRPMAASG
jgi:hypothetical protein